MANPADTEMETAIASIEQLLEFNPTVVGNREAIIVWRSLVKYFETYATSGYDALTQNSDADWTALDSFNGPND